MDPDAKMPDNARKFGPRDRLVRVRCPGLVGKLCPAPHRSISMPPYQPSDAAEESLPRARTTGSDDGEGNRFQQSRRAPAVDAGDAPQARIVRCCSTTESEPPDGTHGNGLTTGVSQQEPYHGKVNDSGKSAANRRNPALLRSHLQAKQLMPRAARICGSCALVRCLAYHLHSRPAPTLPPSADGSAQACTVASSA